jgi:hypothetical protein
MTTTNNKSAERAQVANAAKVASINNESAPKQRAPKFLLNDDAKAELFSLKQALNMVKIAFDGGEHKEQTRAYIFGLGFTAQTFKALTHETLKEYAVTRSGRFSTFAAICAIVKYATAQDLNGEKAAKEARKAERAAAAEARKRIEERKKAEREAEKAAKEEKARKHLAVAKAAEYTKAAEAAEAKRKADAKAARRLAKRKAV